MNKKLRYGLLSVATLTFLALGTACTSSKMTTASSSEATSSAADTVNSAKKLEGKTLPDFKVQNATGEELSSNQLLGSKATLLIVWASWCPDCQQQLPIIEKVYHSYKDRVDFVGINYTDGDRETQEKAAQYLTEKGYTLPVVFDKSSATQEFLGVESIPTMYLIKGNKIEKVFVAVEAEETLQTALDALVK
ncbi:TlpA family protein disulfide reductase [Streptococcus respiraculi]|uniref:TlpA family protein disulfide reductase n=1 Tax=Streptococcus respiraculi TaxID=2021971 RepID=UPI000E770D38|nr:TlpA disulfide reductase family protein [Streptococcus respiraculi]